VEDVARSFVFAGVADTPLYLYVKYRPAGGAPCAPSASSDSGEAFAFYGESVDGSFQLQTAWTWTESGTFLFCMWLAHDSDEVSSPFTRTVTFRNPNGSVSLTTAPPVLAPNVTGTLAVSGTSEAPRSLYVKYRPSGGAACAPSPSTDSGSAFDVYGESVNGAFSFRQTVKFDRAGSYLFCVWLREDSSDVDPIGGTPAAFTVTVRSVVRCRVPRVVGLRLATARSRIRRANCAVGRIRRTRSSRVGRVLGQSPRPGARRPRGTRVDLLVGRR